METKRFRVAILVEVRIVTALEFFALGVIDWETRLIPESRVVTGVVVLIPKHKVMILPVGLVQDLIFVSLKRGGNIEVTFEANEVP